jgi:AraC family transcriptional regulator of arabinose operon
MASRLDDCVVLHWNADPRCAAVVDKHFDGYCSLQHIASGAVELFYNSRRHLLQPGAVWPCFPGPHIRFHRAPGCPAWTHRYVAVRGLLVDEWRLAGLFPHEPVVPAAGMAAEVQGRFEQLLALLAQGGAWQRRRAVNALEGLLLLLAAVRQPRDPDGWVGEAQELLSLPERFPSDVAAVARALGLPASTFRRRFTAAVGMPPRDFAVVARLERGRRLLLDGSATVEAIAGRLGYHDPFLFSRQFRAHTGMSPRRYRSAMAGS